MSGHEASHRVTREDGGLHPGPWLSCPLCFGSGPVEPILHTFITDHLPEGHPWAWDTLNCKNCGTMLHTIPNETMTAWVECGNGNWCLECFAKGYEAADLDELYGDVYGLPIDRLEPYL